MNEPNDEIKIESGVPMPEPRAGSGKWQNLLSQMKIGDSFFIADTGTYALWGRMKSASKHLKIKLATRKEGTGVRVWRIE